MPAKELQVLASSSAKAKFKYPTRDPVESELTDNRTEKEKLQDILRISSQVLTAQELQLWEDIAGQKLSDSMKFHSDLRIPKVVLDSELRKHTKSQTDRLVAAATASDFEPNVFSRTIQAHAAGFEIKKVNSVHLMSKHTQELCEESVKELLFSCKYKLMNYLRSFTNLPRKYIILRACPNLLFNLMKILLFKKVTDKKSARLLSVYKRLLSKNKSPNKYMLKKLISIFFRQNLLDDTIFSKKEVTLFCDFVNTGPTVLVQYAGRDIPWLFDTGSTETLIPHAIWETMGIKDTRLNCNTIYHINSVSHENTDSVKGSISLDLTFPTISGDTFTVKHTCLILRPHFTLATPLFGTDFMAKYSVAIRYQNNIPRITVLDEEVSIVSPYSRAMAACVKPVSVQRREVDSSHIWSNVSDVSSADFVELYEPYVVSQEDTDIVGVNEFLEHNRQAKESYFNSYSVITESFDDILNKEAAQKSIIPDVGCANPQTRLTHLEPELQDRFTKLLDNYSDIFSRHKHHLGTFTGWKIQVEVDPSINCRQPPRNRVLPSSCKQDLIKYKQSGLFNDSTGLADKYCANITLVLRNQTKEIKRATKADKYVQKKSPAKPTVQETRPLEADSKETEPARSLYRMTIDFRNLNRATKNEKTCQLPSVQSIENSFHDSYVTTLDLSNCYPSILLHEDSQNYFNFYMESEILNHARLPQGWSGSLPACQKAVAWTFRDAVLVKFLSYKKLTRKLFPFDSYRHFLKGFVDDLAVHSRKTLENPVDIHILCVEAVFFAIREGGWLVKLEVSTFMNPEFVFLGLFWNLNESASMVQNDRVKAILQHRVPRSMPELASRLATISYFSSFIPLMKRIAMPLYFIVRTGEFKWTQVHLESYNNLLYLMALQVRNYIFNPELPLMMMSDMAALEVSSAIFQWCPDTLSLKLLQTKSLLLTAALRRQSPVHKEAYGTDLTLKEARPYLFQTKSKVNYLFSDASSISYIAHTKPFSSFLQQLSEEVSRHPSLTAIHMPGRAMWYCDLLSRQLDNIIVDRPDTDISKEQSSIIPALRNVKPGAVLTNDELLKVFQTKVGPELFDVSTSDYEYIQKIDFNLYVNPNQFFTSEREFILGGLLSRLDPELALQLPTLKDIFKIKESGTRFDTKVKRLNFINQISEQLKDLPYDNAHLEEIKDFLREKIQEYGLKPSKVVQAHNVSFKRVNYCACTECQAIVEQPSNSLVSSTKLLNAVRNSLDLLDNLNIQTELDRFDSATCPYAKNTLASFCLDSILSYITNRNTFQLDERDLLVFNYHFDHQEKLDIRFVESEMEFVLKNDLTMAPAEIVKLPVNFLTDLKVIPDLFEPEIDSSLALAPQVSFTPLFRMSQMNIANCSEHINFLPKGTVLLTARFPQSQILGISVPLEKLLNHDMLKGDVIGHYFLRNMANAVSKIALNTCAKNVVAHYIDVGKREAQLQASAADSKVDAENPKTIFELDPPTTDLVFQAIHLMNKLLKDKFTCSKTDVATLQRSDLVLRQIYDKCKDGKAKKFRIIDKVLYKVGRQENAYILCVPSILAEQIVHESHSTLSFHFSVKQLSSLLHPLIYHPNLSDMIVKQFKTCLICQVTPPKIIRNLVGAERTQYFKPLECLVIDSLYLPTSKHGFKYGLVMVDAATSKAVVYPSVNLKAATVKRHLRTLFSTRRPPCYLIADYGPEMFADLDGFLAEFNVTMLGTKPYSKGSTAQAEITIRFVKQALRQLVVSHVKTWPEVLPHMLAGLNSAPLAHTTISRDGLFYSPLSVHNLAPLSGFFTPDALFDDHAAQHAKIVLNRQNALKGQTKKDNVEYRVGNIISAENVPIAHKQGESQELRPVVNGFYRVTKVHPTSLRLVSLVNGESRTLPREYCRKRDLTDLSLLAFNFRDFQFKRLINNLFRENRFQTPDGQKIWENLSGFKFPPVPDNIDADDDSLIDTEPLYDTFENEGNLDEEVLSPDIATVPDPIVTNGPLPNAKEPLPDMGLVAVPGDKKYRTTRSGKSYCITLNAPLRSILASPPFTSIADLSALEVQFPPTPQDLQCREEAQKLSLLVGTAHDTQTRIYLGDKKANKVGKKVLTWTDTITERIFDITSKSSVYDHQSMQSLNRTKQKTLQTYFMCTFTNKDLLDVSTRELFWTTVRQPNPKKCLIIHPEDDNNET